MFKCYNSVQTEIGGEIGDLCLKDKKLFEKVIELQMKGDSLAAHKYFKKLRPDLKLDNSKDFDFLFSHLFASLKLKELLKLMDLHHLPPTPIDTQYILGKRAFYLLVIYNRRGASILVKQLFRDIRLFTPTEFRFRGGVELLSYNYEDALLYYKKVIQFKNCGARDYQHSLCNIMFCSLGLRNKALFMEAWDLLKNQQTKGINFQYFDKLSLLINKKIIEINRSDNPFNFDISSQKINPTKFAFIFWFLIYEMQNNVQKTKQWIEFFKTFIIQEGNEGSTFTPESLLELLLVAYHNKIDLSDENKKILFYFPGTTNARVLKLRSSIRPNLKYNMGKKLVFFHT